MGDAVVDAVILGDCSTGPKKKAIDTGEAIAQARATAVYGFVSTFNATTMKKKYRYQSESERLQQRLGQIINEPACIPAAQTYQ
jgi:heme oxygenase